MSRTLYRRARACLLIAIAACTTLLSIVPAQAATPYRAFGDTAYWNKPLPNNAPVAANSSRIIDFLMRDNNANYITLGGTAGSWGVPIYWSDQSSPTYDVRNNCSYPMPKEFNSVRIPKGAKQDPTSDAEFTVYDRGKGIMYAFWRASFNRGTWSACGGTVYYLGSNGLDGRLAESNEPRNHGHRGFAPSTFGVRYDEIKAGQINHVLKIAVDTTKCAHVFPASGDECGTKAVDAPPEGLVLQLKPSVDLQKRNLSRAAMVIAQALKKYGAIIGDQSGGNAILKVENTVAEGRGRLWDGVLGPNSLASLKLSDFRVIKPGYRR
jgi:hypothetical protein